MLTKSILAMVFMVLQLVQSSTSANMRERSHWKKPLCSPPYPRPRTTTMLSSFFSSRRRHTRCSRDWSSDVCSSDLRSGGGIEFLTRLDALDQFFRFVLCHFRGLFALEIGDDTVTDLLERTLVCRLDRLQDRKSVV